MPPTIYRFGQPSQHRYYVLHLQCDLWGDLCLTRIWGNIGQRNGNKLTAVYQTHQAASTQRDQFIKQPKQRGYHLVCSNKHQN